MHSLEALPGDVEYMDGQVIQAAAQSWGLNFCLDTSDEDGIPYMHCKREKYHLNICDLANVKQHILFYMFYHVHVHILYAFKKQQSYRVIIPESMVSDQCISSLLVFPVCEIFTHHT